MPPRDGKRERARSGCGLDRNQRDELHQFPARARVLAVDVRKRDFIRLARLKMHVAVQGDGRVRGGRDQPGLSVQQQIDGNLDDAAVVQVAAEGLASERIAACPGKVLVAAVQVVRRPVRRVLVPAGVQRHG